jgi:four helix bundle protein
MNREELKARTKKFALRVMKMTDALPRNAKGKVLANQVLRSATAVASGYRAACRARSKADWIDKIGRALEEADESLLWLELTEEGGLLPARRISELKQEANELTAIFAAIHKSSRS